MSNNLDPNQACYSVRPDLGSHCLQMLSTDKKKYLIKVKDLGGRELLRKMLLIKYYCLVMGENQV